MKHPLAPLATSLLVALLGLAPVVGRSDSTGNVAEKVVTHHLAAVTSGNVDDILSDYADNAMLIAPSGVTRGKQAIRDIFMKRLGGAAGGAPRPALVLKQKVFEGDIGYIVWVRSAGQPSEQQGSDTFLIKNGKIAVQTVVSFSAH
jgi:ketosteroid isomerase-like protein